MHEPPSEALWAAVAGLRLTHDRRMARVRRSIRRLPRALRGLDAAWIDALVQFGLVTPYQAAKLRSGQADQLRVGPWTIERPLGRLGSGRVFAARALDRPRRVRLIVARRLVEVAGMDCETAQAASISESERSESCANSAAHCEWAARFSRVRDGLIEPATGGVLPIDDAGIDRDLAWFAMPWIDGLTAHDWSVRLGRMPPRLALEIARQSAATLARLEQVGVVYGHLSPQHVLVDGDGMAWLVHPGLKTAIDALDRPQHSACHAAGSAETIMAFGAVVWRLIAGRSPWDGPPAGGCARGAARFLAPNIAHIEPSTPPQLADVVMDCLRREPDARPQSFADLAERLGESNQEDRRRVAAAVADRGSTRRVIAAISNFQRRQHSALLAMRSTLELPVHRIRQWSLGMAATVMLTATVGLFFAPWPRGVPRSPDGSAHIGQAPMRLFELQPQVFDAKVVDPQVRPASLAQSLASPRGETRHSSSSMTMGRARHVERAARPELVLRAGRAIVMAGNELVNGQLVRGENGTRPIVLVPAQGLRVAVDDAVFEGIDFMWSARHVPSQAAGSVAMVRVAASRVSFRDCTFQTPAQTKSFVAAVDWRQASSTEASHVALAHGEIVLERCVVRGVAAALDAHAGGSLSIEMRNVLHLGPGPLVRLDRAPKPDEPLQLALERITIRGGAEALAIARGSPGVAYGRIAVDAVNSVFAPARGAPLISAVGVGDGLRFFRLLRWSGRGSMVDVDVPLAAWQDASLRWHSLADDALAIEGLVRGAMAFKADADGDTNGSQLHEWFAPSGSDEAPGIGLGLPDLPARFP